MHAESEMDGLEIPEVIRQPLFLRLSVTAGQLLTVLLMVETVIRYGAKKKNNDENNIMSSNKTK